MKFVSTILIKQTDWLTIISGHGILIYLAWQGLTLFHSSRCIFSTTKYWYFSYFSMKTGCGYSLELPHWDSSKEYLHWGTSNEYPQYMFSWRKKKNIYMTPSIIWSYVVQRVIKPQNHHHHFSLHFGPCASLCNGFHFHILSTCLHLRLWTSLHNWHSFPCMYSVWTKRVTVQVLNRFHLVCFTIKLNFIGFHYFLNCCTNLS